MVLHAVRQRVVTFGTVRKKKPKKQGPAKASDKQHEAEEAGQAPMDETQVVEEITTSDHEVDETLGTLCEVCGIPEGATGRNELWIGCDGAVPAWHTPEVHSAERDVNVPVGVPHAKPKQAEAKPHNVVVRGMHRAGAKPREEARPISV